MTPLSLSASPEAETQIRSIRAYLGAIDDEIKNRFTMRLEEEAIALCARVAQEIAESGRPFDAPHEEASIYFSRMVYRLEVQTGKTRRRRSSVGRWHVFYVLQDNDSDGLADALYIVSVRHSAAVPFSVESAAPEDDSDA